MTDHVREIYKAVIEDSHYMQNVDRAIEKEIEILLKSTDKYILDEEFEVHRDIIYQAVTVANEETFIVGFRYAISLMFQDHFKSEIF